jgi:DNA-binding CsgD family transcriptional regulator
LLERTDDVPFARRPLTVMRDQRSLVVRVLAGADHSVLLLEAQAPLPHAPALRRLGLTNRETEVLTWVARGKTNADIAAILGLSPRTVEKHLERIFQQLGVETRTAAATRARELAEEA